jgi:hypothetical protein
MTRLSPHFLLSEMTVSQTASRLGIRNVPGPNQIAALTALCLNVLEPVRVHFGRPVIVSSGYRSPAVNRAVGGSSTSQHTRGEASDFTVPGVSNLEVCRWIAKNTQFDQLIYEFGESGWVHCSYGPRHRRQLLSAKRISGKTHYLPGLRR